MVYLQLTGGLGNQMFQYAYLRHFLKHFPDTEVVVDISSYKSDELRDFALNHFNIDKNWDYKDAKNEINKTFRCRFILRKVLSRLLPAADRANNDFETCTMPYSIKYRLLNMMGLYCHYYSRYMKLHRSFFTTKFISGMWHSHYLIDDVLEEVKKDFVLVEKLSDRNQYFVKKMQETNSVCVHVRRGDYLKIPKYWVCDADYYRNAVSRAKSELENPVFFFFSDDIQWAKETFGSGDNLVYMEEQNSDYVDFSVMSSAKHFIISNSTYSWWASTCGSYEEKRVFAPDRWFADEETKRCIYYNDWTLIPTRGTRK